MNKNMKFRISIEEILFNEFEIEAECKEDALEEAKKLYEDEKIVLDSDDYSHTIMDIIE